MTTQTWQVNRPAAYGSETVIDTVRNIFGQVAVQPDVTIIDQVRDSARESASTTIQSASVAPATQAVRKQAVDHVAYTCVTTSDTLMIGNSTCCDIVLNHRSVDNEQAVIFFESGHYWLRNLSKKVTIHHKDHLLGFGDVIVLDAQNNLYMGSMELYVTTVMPEYASLQIRCDHCSGVQDASHGDCVWCGTSLAFGQPLAPTKMRSY